MICGAFIEARSCERFAALGAAIGAPLRDLFRGLHEAEARHYQAVSWTWRARGSPARGAGLAAANRGSSPQLRGAS